MDLAQTDPGAYMTLARWLVGHRCVSAVGSLLLCGLCCILLFNLRTLEALARGN